MWPQKILCTLFMLILCNLFIHKQAFTQEALLEDERNTINVFKASSPSVVFISTTTRQRSWFSMLDAEYQQGSGSGFIWDKQGHIITNFHVINGANKITVTLNDRSGYTARIVGVDPSKDIAVLRIQVSPDKLKPIAIGSSSNLLVGQKVLAIGNPFGLDRTLTTGVISALGRQIRSISNRVIHDVIQVDASINPGNSGGPLLDSRGKLIGMNTAIISPTGASAGIGFAVPVDTIKKVVPQIIANGKVTRVGIGINILPDSQVEEFGIRGVIIHSVLPDSSAERAGLKGISITPTGDVILGDIIISVNNTPINNNDDLATAFEQFQPGDTITLGIIRGNKKLAVKVQLQIIE